MSLALESIIRPGVFFAPSGRHGVLMDLATNRYLAIGAESRLIWEALVERTPLPTVAERYAAKQRVPLNRARLVVARQIRAWKEAGLLKTRTDLESEARLPLPLARPAGVSGAVAFDRALIDRQSLSIPLVARVVCSRHWWQRRLFRHGLAATLVRVQALQPTHPVVGQRAERRIGRVLRAYGVARLAFRQGSKDCLARSIALAAQLRVCGTEIDICIGISPPPFSAHCWLEWQGLLLNENPATLADFTVIGRF